MTHEQTEFDGDGKAGGDEPHQRHQRHELVERLAAALHHAPDGTLAPPAALTATISAAARSALRPASLPLEATSASVSTSPSSTPSATHLPSSPLPRRTSRRRWAMSATLRQGWQTLAAPRPMWAGGAAALLVSVLTIRHWVDEPAPPAVDSRATTPVAAPAASIAAAPAEPATDATALPRPAKTAPAVPPAPAMQSARALADKSTRSTKSTMTGEGSSAARHEADAPAPARASAVPAAATADHAVPVQAAPAAAASWPGAAGTPQIVAPRAAAAPLGSPSPRRPDAAPAPMAKLNGMAPPPLLTAWLGAALRDSDDPDWPLSATQRRVLQHLSSLTGTRWEALAGPAAPSAPGASELSWRDGQGVTVTLRLEASGAHWIEPDGPHWFMPLDPIALAALRAHF